ncbi:MAG: hypothetical protein IPM93_20770 [Candidatus Obscuribacter sp.]|nr:hypothetical protein [Candidatus Obscuribacter sp.]
MNSENAFHRMMEGILEPGYKSSPRLAVTRWNKQQLLAPEGALARL